MPAEQLLYRLFHEDGVRLLAEQSLRFACTCSHERVEQVLLGLGESEALAAAQDDGVATVTCEFCGQNYRFDTVDIGHLFAQPAASAAPDLPVTSNCRSALRHQTVRSGRARQRKPGHRRRPVP